MSLLDPPVATRRRTEVEALRGVAALAVLVSHCWGIAHDYAPTVFDTRRGRLGLAGGQGLALFFALSGYLLTRVFVAAHSDGRTVDVRRYLRHRVARIVPTWWFVLAFMLLVHPDGVAKRDWWRFPLLVQGFWPGTTIRVDGPAWSLALEAQFYLLLPFLAYALTRSRAVTGAFLTVVSVGCVTVVVVTITNGAPGLVWNYSLPVNFVYFLPGIVLAVLEVRWDLVARLRRLPRARASLLVLSVPGWLAYVVAPRLSLLSAVASGLVVAAIALPLDEGALVTFLRGRLLLALGTLSFGIYLWHEPLVRLLHAHGVHSSSGLLVVTLPLTLALAAVSYWLVERPFLRLRDARGPDVAEGALRGDLRTGLAGLGTAFAVLVLALAR